jgi:hypothetical protein
MRLPKHAPITCTTDNYLLMPPAAISVTVIYDSKVSETDDRFWQ